MRKVLAVLLAICVLFAVGCSKEEPVEPAAPAPVPAPAPAPEPVAPAVPTAEGGEVLKVKSADVELGSTVLSGNGKFVSNLQCADGLLSLTLSNEGDEDLIFRRISALESSNYNKDQIAKLIINGRQLNVLEHCGLSENDGVLAPGETATCSVTYEADKHSSEVLIRMAHEELGQQAANQLTFQGPERLEMDFVCSGAKRAPDTEVNIVDGSAE